MITTSRQLLIAANDLVLLQTLCLSCLPQLDQVKHRDKKELWQTRQGSVSKASTSSITPCTSVAMISATKSHQVL